MHGLSKNTQEILDALRARCKVRLVNTSPGTEMRSVGYYLRKAFLELRGSGAILAGIGDADRRVYLPASGAAGLVFTLMHAVLARVAGYRISIHHRSFSYIDRASLFMSWLVRLAGREANHFFLCEAMRAQFESRYGRCANAVVASNAYYVRSNLAVDPAPRPAGPIRIGHLSNLSHEKGLDDFLDLVRVLARSKIPFRATLAGPATSPKTAAIIDAALRELGPALEYMGAVYDKAKVDFFGAIDVFIFPTRYVFEAQPNVVFEALSFGVPVIAFARGCVASDLPDTCGEAVPVGSDFVAAAHRRIASWAGDRGALSASATAARAAAECSCQEATRSFEMMLGVIAGSG
jgi:glycosyltransferase involved in cell wall biosynthesis